MFFSVILKVTIPKINFFLLYRDHLNKIILKKQPFDRRLFCSRHCSTSDQRSRYSGSPYSNGWDATLQSLSQKKILNSYQYTLGDDGLIPLKCVIQERLDQIIEEQKVRLHHRGNKFSRLGSIL